MEDHEPQAVIEEINKMNRQIGDYVIAELKPNQREVGGLRYAVRMAGAREYLSFHADEPEAMRAIRRYQTNDRRRSKK